jgi:hypothetical protein
MNHSELSRILHNIADHTHVLERLFTSGGLAGAFRDQLMTHIRHEEAENQRQLHELQGGAGDFAYEIETLIQHSRLLSELTTDTASDPALVASILHHFGEEHEWFEQTLERSGASAPTQGRQGLSLTVGSMIEAP